MTPRVALALAVAWTAFLFVMISVPGSEFGVPPPGVDKLAHVAFFLVGAVLWRRAGRSERWVAVAGLAYAVLTEVWQHAVVPGRVGDPIDALANALGLALGLWAVRRLRPA